MALTKSKYFDVESIKDNIGVDDPDILRELLSTYVEGLSDALYTLQIKTPVLTMNEYDVQEVYNTLHTIKGTTATVNATSLSSMAAVGCVFAKDKKIPELKECIATVANELNLALSELADLKIE